MDVLVVNPNRVPGCTALIQRAGAASAPSDVNVTTVSPDSGPVQLTGQRETLLSAMGVLERVARGDLSMDAVVLAGFGEPGSEAVREAVDVPVVDITEAGPLMAMLVGRKYGIVTSTLAAVPVVEDRLKVLGLDARLSSIETVNLGTVAMAADRERALEAATVTAKLAVQSGAESVVLGCGGLAGLDVDLSARLDGVPVIDPVVAAIELAAQLVRMRLSSSRVLSFSQAGSRDWGGWPVEHRNTAQA